jgi:hypothetical protein
MSYGILPKNIQTSHPGNVGSVGDVLVKSRCSVSTPAMTPRFDAYFIGHRHGGNVQDGNSVSYDSKGGGAKTRDTKWGGHRSFKTPYGWEHHDVQIPDKRTEPWVSSLGDYSWRNKVATVRDAKRTGNMFLPTPGGYQPEPGDLARGGSQIRLTNTLGGDATVDDIRTMNTLNGKPIGDADDVLNGINRSRDDVVTGVIGGGVAGRQPIGLGMPKLV